MDDITSSHPDFDRSKLSDAEYIERLLFEIKELKATLSRKDLLIQSLQGNLRFDKEPSTTAATTTSSPSTTTTTTTDNKDKENTAKDPLEDSTAETHEDIGIPVRSARRKPTDQDKVPETKRSIRSKVDPPELDLSYEGLRITKSNEPLTNNTSNNSTNSKLGEHNNEETTEDYLKHNVSGINSPKDSARDLSKEISKDISRDTTKDPKVSPKISKQSSLGSLKHSEISIGDISASTAISNQAGETYHGKRIISGFSDVSDNDSQSIALQENQQIPDTPESNRSSVYSNDDTRQDNEEHSRNYEESEEITPVYNQTTNQLTDNVDESAIESTLSDRSTMDQSNPLQPYKSTDTQASANRSNQQPGTQNVSANQSGSGIFQQKNNSNSSFLSYKSRIRLPHTMQQPQVQSSQPQPLPQFQSQPQQSYNNGPTELRYQYGDNPISPQRSQQPAYGYTSPQQHSNEPPRIPLPQSPDESRSNILSPSGAGITQSKTLKDLNIQNLKVDVPPPAYKYANESNSLRSPASINPISGPLQDADSANRLHSPRKQEFKEVPNTPDAFYSSGVMEGSRPNNLSTTQFDEAISNISSPAPPSQYSQASPITGYSNGGFGYDNDSLRTPGTANDFVSHDSIYNYRGGMNSNKNSKNGSSFLVNKQVSNQSEIGSHLEEDALFIKPEDFQSISINVVSTISTGNSMGQSNSISLKKLDDIHITLSINDRESGKEMWRIRKSLNQLVAFDNEIRPTVEYFGLPILPDKSLFFSSTPNKIDIRRSGLQNYFNTLFVMPHIPHLILFRICKYLSLDFVNPLDDFKSGAKKEGYLVRKYKGLGTNWKIRWCQVDGPQLELYDSPGGTMLELINLVNCQIGRQSSDSVAEDKGYRHAFLIMESGKTSKLSSSIPKHFFCAETDAERDEWVSMLIESNEGLTSSSPLDVEEGSSSSNFNNSSTADTTLITTPRAQSDYQDDLEGSLSNQATSNVKSPAVLHTSYNTVDTDKSFDSSKDKSGDKDKKNKKRSLFPFRKNAHNHSNSNQIFDQNNIIDNELNNSITSPPNSNIYGTNSNTSNSNLGDNSAMHNYGNNGASGTYPYQSSYNSNSNSQFHQNHHPNSNNSASAAKEDSTIQLYLDRMGLDEGMNKQIFGRDVKQAYEISHHTFLDRSIPSICYRCVDFLIRTGAIYEEGIFRLSGSASTIRQLKELFNKRYDVDLFENELKPDIHTVAGLFKTYLRELPSPILTDKVYNDLRQMVTARGSNANTALMCKDYLSNGSNIPKINYDLSYIIFKFLKEIVNNNNINKMNLRNMCIVFVPTLNISLDVLSLLLVDFNCIFENQSPVPDNQRENIELNIPSF